MLEDVLEVLLSEDYELVNANNGRKIMASPNFEGWCVYENGDSMNEIIETDDVEEAMEIFEK